VQQHAELNLLRRGRRAELVGLVQPPWDASVQRLPTRRGRC
jgi:hypothetical protein